MSTRGWTSCPAVVQQPLDNGLGQPSKLPSTRRALNCRLGPLSSRCWTTAGQRVQTSVEGWPGRQAGGGFVRPVVDQLLGWLVDKLLDNLSTTGSTNHREEPHSQKVAPRGSNLGPLLQVPASTPFGYAGCEYHTFLLGAVRCLGVVNNCFGGRAVHGSLGQLLTSCPATCQQRVGRPWPDNC